MKRYRTRTQNLGLTATAAGAAVGSVIPGIGTVVGGLIGGVVDMFGGGQNRAPIGDIEAALETGQYDLITAKSWDMAGLPPDGGQWLINWCLAHGLTVNPLTGQRIGGALSVAMPTAGAPPTLYSGGRPMYASYSPGGPAPPMPSPVDTGGALAIGEYLPLLLGAGLLVLLLKK